MPTCLNNMWKLNTDRHHWAFFIYAKTNDNRKKTIIKNKTGFLMDEIGKQLSKKRTRQSRTLSTSFLQLKSYGLWDLWDSQRFCGLSADTKGAFRYASHPETGRLHLKDQFIWTLM